MGLSANHRFSRLRGILVSMIMLVSVSGCGSGQSGPTISGKIDQGSFPNQIEAVVAYKDGQEVGRAQINSDGSFVIPVGQPGSYRIEIKAAGQSLPLVFVGSTVNYNRTFSLDGVQSPDLGHVSYLNVNDIKLQKNLSFAPAATEDPNGIDCVDGIDSATGSECDGGPSANTTETQ